MGRAPGEQTHSRVPIVVGRAAAAALFAGVCIYAVYAGWNAVKDDTWPFYHDAWRDVGLAQSILDGRYPEDPIIAGAANWYNPAVGALVATVSAVTGMPPPVADARMGAFAQALIPIMFFILLWLLFGHWTACVGSIFLICGNALVDELGLWGHTLTYSPWIWAPSFSQAFLLATLAAYLCARRTDKLHWHMIMGLLWGVTFMTHTAPAVMIGLIALVLAVGQGITALRKKSAPGLGHVAGRFFLEAGVAFVSSLPFSGPILWKHQFIMEQDSPIWYTDGALELGNLGPLLVQCVNVSNAIALVGMVVVLLRVRRSLSAQLVVVWLALAWVFMAQNYVNQILAQNELSMTPQFVPPHHWFQSLGALKALLFAVGLLAGVRLVAAGALRLGHALWDRVPGGMPHGAWRNETVCFLAAAGLLLVLLPRYMTVAAFPAPMDFGWHTESFDDRTRLYQWMVENTAPDAVFLCDEQLAVRFVGPAGRKLVRTMNIFSNPYMPHEPRVAAQDVMFDALAESDEQRFREAAEEYGVTHVLVREEAIINRFVRGHAPSMETLEKLDLPFLERVYHEDHLAVYRVLPATQKTHGG
ncbi:MAG: hypothetical protein ACLFTT_03820 [Candidatus Hydrogenedentota bacterium]